MRFLAAGPALLFCGVVAACAPTDRRVVLHELRHQLAGQVHECVPLGWNPVPAGGSYYPGFTAQYQDEVSWLAPLWLGSIYRDDLSNPQARTSYAILNHLEKAGMVRRIALPGKFHYRLTVAAMPYFYARNEYGDNRDAFPYLCYSAIVPDRVVWTDSIRRRGKTRIFRAAFTWHASAPASWANDPYLRSHSVVLPPDAQTIVATFVDDGDGWSIAHLSTRGSGLPRLAVSSAWHY